MNYWVLRDDLKKCPACEGRFIGPDDCDVCEGNGVVRWDYTPDYAYED